MSERGASVCPVRWLPEDAAGGQGEAENRGDGRRRACCPADAGRSHHRGESLAMIPKSARGRAGKNRRKGGSGRHGSGARQAQRERREHRRNHEHGKEQPGGGKKKRLGECVSCGERTAKKHCPNCGACPGCGEHRLRGKGGAGSRIDRCGCSR